MITLWTVDEATEHGDCKFVIVNGIVRLFNQTYNHCEAVESGETATDAGYIVIKIDRIVLEDSYSVTLKIHCTSKGETILEKHFGKSVVGRYE